MFAECGYEGTSIATVAEQAGLSKQNLMYYFPTKQALYQRVLDDVLDDWLERMDQPGRSRRRAGRRAARLHPGQAALFARAALGLARVCDGGHQRRARCTASRYASAWCRWCARISTCSSAGSREGRIAAVNATHLLFAIWAMTQSYADFAAQMGLVLNQQGPEPPRFRRRRTDHRRHGGARRLPATHLHHAMTRLQPPRRRPCNAPPDHAAPIDADAPAILAMYADPEVTRYWSSLPWTELARAHEYIEQAARDVAAGTAVRLGIVVKGTDLCVGQATLFHFDVANRRCEIGYALHRAPLGPRLHRRGPAGPAGLRLRPAGTAPGGSGHRSPQRASLRTVERLGFQRKACCASAGWSAARPATPPSMACWRDWRAARQRRQR